MSDYTYQDVMAAQNSSFGADSAGTIYTDPAIATQASVDWAGIVNNGLGRIVDLEIRNLFTPNVDAHAINTVNGQDAGTVSTAAKLQSAMPLLIGAALVLVLIVYALRK